jgi:D-3-phosphoglycerate dehydrogenase
MRKGAFLINAARGTVVDIGALAAALKGGHVGGTAIDVFPEEPQSNADKFESELQGVRNVILTPHIGGSTEEAQEAIGREVSTSLILTMKTGMTLGAVNFPQVAVPVKEEGCRLINVHKNVPGVLSEVNGIMAKHKANIKAQYLSTDAHIGYLVMDIEIEKPQKLFEQVEELPTSIKTRLV